MSEEALKSTINYEAQVTELSQKVERLKFLYEQYFMGRERIAPQILRQDVERSIRELIGSLNLIKNTALRFQVNSLRSKLNSYRRHWDRSLQQIEDGTHRRDKFRLKIHQEQASEDPPTGKHAAKKSQPSSNASKAPAKKPNANVDKLMQQFIDAKKKCKEPVKGISYQAFAKTLSSQSQVLKKKYKCKSVRFKVVIENGKTKLKATPK